MAKTARLFVNDKFKPAKRGSSTPAFVSGFINAAKYYPLLAAIWAPVSTLLDIPALTQSWYLYADTGAAEPDKGASIILSSFSLAFNAFANILLVMRFSSGERWWRPATTASVICWAVKLVFALVNLGVFGNESHTNPDVVFGQGFWCAVMSVIIAGCITLLLTVHYFLQFDRPDTARDAAQLRVTGRSFMLSVASLVSLLGLEALLFSRVEHWSYLDGIYFAIITTFTIGFGDFYPTYNVTRILLFPCAVASIALVAVQIGVIVDFIGAQAERRKARWRAAFEEEFQRKREAADDAEGVQPSLVEEIERLQTMQEKEAQRSRMFDLVVSVISLVIFWVIGAAIFSKTEGWAYGTSMYFTYVAFLTIGYGDYSPISAAGRVVFVVYALLAVPVVTSFVVQTVTSLVSAFASRAMQRARDEQAPTQSEEKLFHSHAHYVHRSSKELGSHYQGLGHEDEASRLEDQRELTRLVLDLAVQLEADARSLIIDHLASGSKAQVILRADRVLHLRALERIDTLSDNGDADPNRDRDETRTVEKSPSSTSTSAQSRPWLSTKRPDGFLSIAEGLLPAAQQDSAMQKELAELDTLERVRRYRETFGALLSAGSLLLKLEGVDRSRFERRLEDEHQRDYGGVLLGGGRKGPAEIETGVDV